MIIVKALGKFNNIEELINVIKSNPHITRLDLSSNSIGDAGARALAGALGNTNITHLDLSDNIIGEAGARALAGALNKKITHFDLSTNRIGDAGARALAEALRNTKNITYLDLSTNSIRDAGAEALAEALGNTKNITFLTLTSNWIGKAGALALAKALENKNIISLNLSANPLSREGCKALNDVLKLSPHILEVFGTKVFGTTHLAELDARLKQNRDVFKYQFPIVDQKDASALAECEGGASAPQPEEVGEATCPSYPNLMTLYTLPYTCTTRLQTDIFGESWSKVEEVYLDPKYFTRNFFKIYRVCKALPGVTKIEHIDDSGQKTVVIRPALPLELWWAIWEFLGKDDFSLDLYYKGGHDNSAKTVELPYDDTEVRVAEAGAAAAPHPDEMCL